MRNRVSWPISRVLAAVLSLVIILLVGGLTAFSLQTLQQATFEQIAKRGAQDINATVERLRAHLRPARDQVVTLSGLLREKSIGFGEKGRLSDILRGALTPAPQIQALIAVETDYRALIAVRDRDGRLKLSYQNEANNERLQWAMRTAAEVEDPFWGAPLFIPELGTLINVIAPVRVDGVFRGIIGATVKVSELSTRMAEFRSDLSTGSFVLWDQSRLLAHPQMTNPLEFGVNESKPLPDAVEVGDLVVSAFVTDRFVTDNFHDPSLFLDIKVIELPGRDRPYIVASRELADYGPPTWTVGAYVNAETFTGERWFLIILGSGGIVVLIAGVAIALWLGVRIARPVRKLAETAEQIAAVEDPGGLPPLPPSRIREIDQAGKAFNRMTTVLRDRAFLRATFGKYVPESVARLILENRSFVQEPQLRNATILFTDIAGFTGLCEKLSPAETIEVLNDYFSAVVEPIETNGGVIQQYQGDAMLATFNIPNDRPHHADDALKAAIEIERILAERCFGPGLRIRTRIGINTGDIVGGTVGAGGRLGYTVHGDPVNIAARLESMNKDFGTLILLSDETRRQATINASFRPMGTVDIRGRTQPVSIYTLSDGELPDEQESPAEDQRPA
jgi:class 3 adenylate cyclase